MSEVPEGLRYTKEHEWVRVEEDEILIGITDHAQEALTDIVYVELPEKGTHCEEMSEFAIIESVKSASPIFAPLSGEIIAINEALEDAPELVNQEPYGEGWIVRIKLDDSAALRRLMTASEYRLMIEE